MSDLEAQGKTTMRGHVDGTPNKLIGVTAGAFAEDPFKSFNEPGDINLYAVNRGSATIRMELRLPEGDVPRSMRILDAEHRLATNRLGEDRIRLRECAPASPLVLPPISLVHLAVGRGRPGDAGSSRERT